MPDAPTPEMLKKMRLASEGTSLEPPPSSTPPSKRVATVQDADDDDDTAELIGGETFAPGNDPDYFTEEDEEGRFFGGGLTNEQKEILNIFDNAGAEQVPDDVRICALSNTRTHTHTVFNIHQSEMLSSSGIKKLLLRLERAANKNQAQRSKYPDDPTKWADSFPVLILTITVTRFIDSEADLDTAIKALLPLAQVPKVAYPLLVGSGQLEALVGLLSHENADIALDVIELIHELTDEDVGEEDEDEDDPDQREAALKSLISALVRLAFIKEVGKCAYMP
jgi:beta-catenin-like protein 1